MSLTVTTLAGLEQTVWDVDFYAWFPETSHKDETAGEADSKAVAARSEIRYDSSSRRNYLAPALCAAVIRSNAGRRPGYRSR